jgi:GT2 family glycosyltransferase
VNLTICVCTRERPELLATSLPTVIASAGTAGAAVIVVEQGDSNATRFGEDVLVITDSGRGASRARNIGLTVARTELVLFTDDDCAVRSDWAKAHAAALSDSNVWMTLGSVEGLSNGREVDFDLRRVRPWLLGHSANMGVRRQEVLNLGGFDERLGAGVWARGGEDADLIVRVVRSSGRLRTDVGPAVRHLDWRDHEETSEVRRGYERGAGAWLGRSLRRRDRLARRYAAARACYLRDLVRAELRAGHRIEAARVTGEFAAGLAFGLVARR